MKEYRGVKYEQKPDGWHLCWPSGLKTVAQVETEEELKAKIDELANG